MRWLRFEPYRKGGCAGVPTTAYTFLFLFEIADVTFIPPFECSGPQAGTEPDIADLIAIAPRTFAELVTQLSLSRAGMFVGRRVPERRKDSYKTDQGNEGQRGKTNRAHFCHSFV
jgi:hypothetical protein